MISDELSRIIEQLKKQGQMSFCQPATKEQIEEYEQKNGFSLPEKYREWLLFSDGGECFLPAGVQFYGISHKPIINADDNDRPNDRYVVIGALSTGDPVLCKKSEEEISIYNHETGRIEDDEKYKDFFEFLNDLYDLLGIGE